MQLPHLLHDISLPQLLLVLETDSGHLPRQATGHAPQVDLGLPWSHGSSSYSFNGDNIMRNCWSMCEKKWTCAITMYINLWRTLFNCNFSVPLSVHFLGASVFSPAAMSFTGLSSSFGPLSLGNGNQKPWHQWALTRFPHPFPQTPEADVCGQYNWCFNTDQHHTKKKVGWFCLIFSPRQVS